MTTTTSSTPTAVAVAEPVFSPQERLALAGFLVSAWVSAISAVMAAGLRAAACRWSSSVTIWISNRPWPPSGPAAQLALTMAALTGLSPAGASRHLLTLRDAGLLTTARHGHQVRYARTELGSALLRARRQ